MKPRFVQRWLKRLLQSFQSKWMIPLMITTILPLLVSLVLVLQITSNHSHTQQVNGLLERTMQISQETNARFNEIKQAGDAIANYVVSQTRDSSRPAVQDSAALMQFQIYRDNIVNMEALYGIDRIRVFSDRTPFLQRSNYVNFYPTEQLDRLAQQYPQLLEPVSLSQLNYIVQDQVLLYTSRTIKHVDMVSFYRPIYNSDRELTALFMMDFTCDSFLTLADRMDTGGIIFSTAEGRVICSGYDEEATRKLLDVAVDPQKQYMLDNNRIVVRYPVPLTDWTLTVSIPLTNDYAPWDAMVGVYVIILFATFLLSLGVGYLISHMQARRLRSYFDAVRNVDYAAQQHAAALPDQLDELLANVRHPDEVDQLMSSFSTLVRDNLKLISSTKQHDLEIEKYKFKVLQEQINPHFLYNALETLRLCMLMGRKQDALKSLDSLSRFYRIALSKGRDTVCVREELDMIRNYLEIENIGYAGAIQWNMDVEEECLDLPIPKFLLQPLVENSILHSKAAVEDGALCIDVMIHIVGDQLSMIVRDNGVGIDADTLAAIREGLASNTMQKGKNGFGLSNVNRRLKLFYGAEYGLEMRSVPGCTENVIILPVDILW